MGTAQNPSDVGTGCPHGPLAMLVTAFDDAHEIDLPGMVEQARYAVTQGAVGVALFGLAGEGAKLSEAEREAVVDTVAQALDGDYPLVAVADHGGTRIAARIAERLVSRGATHIMALPPPAATPARLVRSHFEALADSAGVAVIIQDAPAASQVLLTVEVLSEVVSTVAGVCGIKVEAAPIATKVTALRAALPRPIALYGGRGGVAFLAEITAGADGTMVGPMAVGGFARAWAAWCAGDFDGARRHIDTLLPLAVLAEGNDLYAQMQKVLLYRAGVIGSPTMRLPSVPAPEWLRDEWLAAETRVAALRGISPHVAERER
jgi:dihydrodipicolinate synthase/N-acetylneuraminate lyase